ncbi:RNA pseudouridylate synthase, putative [Plasmodium yoelii]|uniref:RNA pseudouridylate synthase n=2 Tax=Plasmodium yoelii TaxID=5861 RepID=A0AAF0B7L7_PLAYO|nr:RNA pseudouridylate synthase, putative [Plasmodium yoelii]WBY61066.1 RNA pseudouridylate synthase [Plasmodium yoelii yoelii]CDU20802.1 RNA pseudouridylate synthase, putative [Plasmodium yoelii]VTZ81765.1 RNA pseudouridylate synthase, putative [Plasmodium yoelii]|eukprot:XP_022812982.1 RNA pseudouridylate synthase, putative [Plasmodium yoelii]
MFPSVQLKKTIFLRLSKILSLSSVVSRNKAQELIRSGNVKVDNQIVKQNTVIDVNSKIEVNGCEINVDITTKLWGIYKPKHVFCNTDQNYIYEEKKLINPQKKDILLNDGNDKLQISSEHTKKILGENNMMNNKTLIYKSDFYNNNKMSRNYNNNIIDQNIHFPNYTETKMNKRKIQDNEKKITLSTNTSKLNVNLFDFIKKKNILYEEKNKIENYIPEHLIIVNSLDSDMEGIILLTNDGDFANKLKDINNNILTTYLIKTQEELTNEKIELLRKGCTIGDIIIRPLELKIIKPNFLYKWLKLTYVEKSQTHLNLLFSKYNMTIRKCKRYSFGPYKSSDLSGNFLTPLKIHSTINHLIPRYEYKLTLSHPTGNILMDSHQKCIKIKDYLNDSVIRE